MTWSTPENPGERIAAPNVGARPADELRDAQDDGRGAGAPGAHAPLFSTPNYPEPAYREPANPDPRFPIGGSAPNGYGQGFAGGGPAAPPEHLAYPIAPYVPAPYTTPRASGAGALTLSIVALCLSGGSFLVALIPVLQFVWWMVGIAGIVCGFIALRREPRGRALAITSIVLGFISVFGFLLLIVLALLFFGGIGLLGGLSSY
ncbi:hypothetical protein C5B85_11855 [Pseudoclavibacter sp. AY1F1]|uniref:DUF4190 domain-containing protein n=1 Tax=Pseudoclavibacter sp. AY1F1 TaxID=2080583 RepID=UPI000CE77280|nr:DUF4190 domain-containing protein [Pseudoclavibacter sp. AY1F1]PPF43835.1 hypothetical protein C5B85_11855 [Pseudoclavibacter sp. AY1F1]